MNTSNPAMRLLHDLGFLQGGPAVVHIEWRENRFDEELNLISELIAIDAVKPQSSGFEFTLVLQNGARLIFSADIKQLGDARWAPVIDQETAQIERRGARSKICGIQPLVRVPRTQYCMVVFDPKNDQPLQSAA